MQGMSFSSLKKHPAYILFNNDLYQKLIPLYVCVGVGCIGAVYYTLRLATRNPDVTWNRKTNPEPWQEYRDKQYKFYSPIRDYSKEESQATKILEK